MKPETIALIRWILLAAFVTQLVSVSALFPTIWQRIMEPQFKAAAERGQPVPPLLRSQSAWRGFAAFMCVFLFVAWWYLGTADGATRFADAVSRMQ